MPLGRNATLLALAGALALGASAAAGAVGAQSTTGSSGPTAIAAPPAGLEAKLLAAMKPFARNSGAYVLDLDTGQVIFSENATRRRYPASVEKLYTLTTALALFGATGTLQTSVYGVGTLSPTGVFTGNLYVRGGGDPTFGDSGFIDKWYGGVGTTVVALARQLIAATHITRVHGSVVGDASYFDSLVGDPASDFLPDPNLAGELSALSFDRGAQGAQGSPAAHAAWELAGALRHAGVQVTGRSQAGTTPVGAQLLTTIASPTIGQLAALTAGPSDDFFAEMLLKALGARFGTGGTTAAGANVMSSYLAKLGLTPHVVDGSGLARGDLTTALQVVTLLRDLSPGGNAELQSVGQTLHAALPVAGETGTLAARMRGTAAAGNCQAKTGTLSDASDLAGWCDDRYVFAILINHCSLWRAQRAEDVMVEAIAKLAAPATAKPPKQPRQ